MRKFVCICVLLVSSRNILLIRSPARGLTPRTFTRRAFFESAQERAANTHILSVCLCTANIQTVLAPSVFSKTDFSLCPYQLVHFVNELLLRP